MRTHSRARYAKSAYKVIIYIVGLLPVSPYTPYLVSTVHQATRIQPQMSGIMSYRDTEARCAQTFNIDYITLRLEPHEHRDDRIEGQGRCAYIEVGMRRYFFNLCVILGTAPKSNPPSICLCTYVYVCTHTTLATLFVNPLRKAIILNYRTRQAKRPLSRWSRI